MNKEVSFKLAIFLKEKEFDRETKYNYDLLGEKHNVGSQNHNSNTRKVSAPTIADVVMYIYDKYNQKMGRFKADLYKLFSYNCTLDGRSENRQEFGWEKPEEAYESAIEYVLNNLI